MTQPPTELHYEPRKSLVRRRWKRVVLMTLLVAIAFSLFWWRRTIQLYARHARVMYVQRQALDYTIDPDRIVYDERPSAMLTDKGGSIQLHPRANGENVMLWDPKVCDPLMGNVPPGILPKSPRAMLFLHERATQSGRKLLLVVYATIEPPNQYHPTESLMFHMQELTPAVDWQHGIYPANGLGTPLTGLDFADRNEKLRIYGGQVDPTDPTHFTMRYKLGDKEGIIDGWEGERTEDANGIPTPGLRLEVREEKKTGSLK